MISNAHKGIALIVLPLAIEFLLVGALIKLESDSEREIAREAHSRQVLQLAGQLAAKVFEQSKSLTKTDDPDAAWTALQQRLDEVRKDEETLLDLTRGHPNEEALSLKIQKDLDKIELTVNEGRREVDEGIPLLVVLKHARKNMNRCIDDGVETLLKLSDNAREVETESPKITARYRRQVVAILIIAVVFNVLASIVLAKQIRESERKRSELERMKQEFLAMVSHDLRTPLTSVRAAIVILSSGMHGELTDDGKATLADAEVNVERLINMINDLLDIERMEAGKLEIERAPVTVSSLFDRSLSAVRGYASQQDVKLVTALENDELRTNADAERIVQVLVNLLSNAIKFSPAQSQVELGAKSAPDADEVEIFVRDHGRGIPENVREKIFDRFAQASSADAKTFGGSGLGLAICKAIVEAHQGKIGVESCEGEGSRFWIRLRR